jgi:hypothetical protein
VANRSHGGKAFLNGENAVANASVNGVKRDEGIAGGLLCERQGLDEEDFLAFVGRFFLGSNDLSNDLARIMGVR